ncbi:MAG: translocation/assembly module TamB domain-containing protein [Thainema sp.]
MTSPDPNRPQPESESPPSSRRRRRILNAIAITGISFGTLGILGYLALSTWIYRELPSFLENRLEETLDREVKIGGVENFTLTRIRFGPSSIPATPTDPDRIATEAIDLSINPFPLIRKNLHLDIELLEPVLYIEQAEDGSWLDLEFDSQGGEFPLDIDATIELKEAEAAFLPLNTNKAIGVAANGTLQVVGDSEQQTFRYDFIAELADGVAEIQGETLNDEAATKATALLRDIQLAQLTPLLDSLGLRLPVEVVDGELSANLRVDLPSIRELSSLSLYGTVALDQLAAQVEPLEPPITLEGMARFVDQTVVLESLEAAVDDTVAELEGTINFDRGYNLDIDVPSVEFEDVLALAEIEELPIELQGAIQAEFELTGEIDDPQLAGVIRNLRTTQIDEVALDDLQVEFEASLERFVLEELAVSPVVGGDIRAEGFIQFESFEEFLSNPIALDLEVENLPTDTLAALYGVTTPNIRFGTLNANGRIGGTLEDLTGGVTWRLPNAYAEATGAIAALGELQLDGSNLLIRDTRFNLVDQAGAVLVTGQANLDTSAWQSQIQALNVDLSQIPALRDALQSSATLASTARSDRLNAQLALSGNFASLFNDTPTTTITADAIAAQLGDQAVTAAGQFDITQVPGGSLIVSTLLDVTAQSNLASLPQALINQQVRDRNIDLRGLANFQGQLQADNLLSGLTAPGNLNLTGNLNLADFALNQIAFESLLSGPVSITPGQEIVLDLRGQTRAAGRDRIAARLTPCVEARCQLPYLPEFIALRQGGLSPDAVIVSGERRGDILDVSLENFSLALFDLAPGQQVGLQGPVQGQVTGDIAFNLFTFDTSGSITVEQPGLDYILANQFTADFTYRDGIVELTSGSLSLLDRAQSTEYALQGRLNLATGALNAQIDVVRGYVQDLFFLTKVFTVGDVQRGLAAPTYLTANQIYTNPQGTPYASLEYQIKLLIAVTRDLQQLAIARQQATAPEYLDIQGEYTGEVNISGTLSSPTVAFDIAMPPDENWVWYPDAPYLVYDEPLDLTAEPEVVVERPEADLDTQQEIEAAVVEAAIEPEDDYNRAELVRGRELIISDFSVSGVYQNGAISVAPGTQIELENQTLLTVAGPLAPSTAAEFELSDLTVDVIREFVSVPFDIEGEINASGLIQGGLGNPTVTGNVAFTDAELNQEPVTPILGDFRYANARLNFVTTPDSLVTANASIPLPPSPGNDDFEADVYLDTEAIQVLLAFTDDQVEWVDGEATVDLDARGRLDFSPAGLQALRATGEANFDNATVDIARIQQYVVDEQLILNGELLLDQGRIRANDVVAQFAEGDVLIGGVLPIIAPIGSADPDAATPLTVLIEEQEFDIDSFYDGEVDGSVVLTGSAAAPIVSGSVTLYDGEVSIPERESVDPDDSDLDDEPDTTFAAIASLTEAPEPQSNFGWTPIFDDFQLVLGRGFGVDNFPLYSVRVRGPLAINGTLNNLQANGVIDVTRARINLFSSQFYLTRRPEGQTITFSPELELTNPYVNVQLSATAFENFALRREEVSESEIRDDIIPNIRPEEIEVFLTVDGPAQSLLPDDPLTSAAEYCQVRSPATFLGESLVTPEHLQSLEDCLLLTALSGDLQDQQVIQSPVVELSSVPERSNSQIVSLLGNQFLAFAEEAEEVISGGSEEDIVLFGVSEFVVKPLIQNWLRDVDDFTDSLGEEVGLSQFRVLPTVRATRQLDEDSALDFQYDYQYGQFRVQYRLRF